jgi:preprotein translocase subunit SecD
MKRLLLLAAALAFAAPVAASPRTTLEFRLVVPCTGAAQPLALKNSSEKLCVAPALIADLANVTAAQAGFVNGFDAIRVTLDTAAAARMKAATSGDGVRIGILLDGRLVSAPAVYGPISKDVEVDFGEHGPGLQKIAAAIQAGMGKK